MLVYFLQSAASTLIPYSLTTVAKEERDVDGIGQELVTRDHRGWERCLVPAVGNGLNLGLDLGFHSFILHSFILHSFVLSLVWRVILCYNHCIS